MESAVDVESILALQSMLDAPQDSSIEDMDSISPLDDPPYEPEDPPYEPEDPPYEPEDSLADSP